MIVYFNFHIAKSPECCLKMFVIILILRRLEGKMAFYCAQSAWMSVTGPECVITCCVCKSGDNYTQTVSTN